MGEAPTREAIKAVEKSRMSFITEVKAQWNYF
jgi:hypothetical protein